MKEQTHIKRQNKVQIAGKSVVVRRFAILCAKQLGCGMPTVHEAVEKEWYAQPASPQAARQNKGSAPPTNPVLYPGRLLSKKSGSGAIEAKGVGVSLLSKGSGKSIGEV